MKRELREALARRKQQDSLFVLAVIAEKEEHRLRKFAMYYTYTRYLRVRAATNSFRSHGRFAKYARSNLDEPQNSKKYHLLALYVCGHIYGRTGWVASNRTHGCPFYLSFYRRNFLRKLRSASQSTRNGKNFFLIFLFFFFFFGASQVALRILFFVH